MSENPKDCLQVMSWPPRHPSTRSGEGATQLNQSAALRHATAHTAAAVTLWLLWRGQHNYTIMILTRVPVAIAKQLLNTI